MAIKNLEDLIEISDEEVKDFGIDTNLLEEVNGNKDDDEDSSKKSKKANSFNKEDELEVEDDTDENEDTEEDNETKEVFSDDDENTDDDQTEQGGNLFGEFSNELREGGLFPNLNDNDFEGVDSLEDIGNLINKQSSANLMTWKNEYVQNIVANLINDGVINKDQAQEYVSNSYTPNDFENDTIAKEVIREYHIAKELPKDMSDRIINSEVDLKEAAIEAHNYLNKYKEKRNSELAKKTQERDAYTAQERETFQTKLKEEVYAYDEFIPGNKLNPKEKLEVLNSIPGVMEKINKNFTHFAPILAYLDRNKILDLDFDKLITKGETKSTNKMESILRSKKKKTGDGTSNIKESAFKIDDSDIKNVYKFK